MAALPLPPPPTDVGGSGGGGGRTLSRPPAAYVAGAAGVLATLRRVDTAVADLYAGPAVRRAVWRYEAVWLPLLAALGCDADPPAAADGGGGCGGGGGGGSGGRGRGAMLPSHDANVPFAARVAGVRARLAESGVDASTSATRSLLAVGGLAAALRPPLDVEWVWLLHRQAPATYLSDIGRWASAPFFPSLPPPLSTTSPPTTTPPAAVTGEERGVEGSRAAPNPAEVLWAVASGGAEPFEPPHLDVRLGRGGVLLRRRSSAVTARPSGSGGPGATRRGCGGKPDAAPAATADPTVLPPPHLSPAHRLASVDLVAAAAAGRLLAWQLLRPAWAPPVGDPAAAAGGVAAAAAAAAMPPAGALAAWGGAGGVRSLEQFLLLVADTADDEVGQPPPLPAPPLLAPSAAVLLLWTGAMAATAAYATDCRRLAGRVLPGPLDAAHRGGALRWYSAAEPFGDIPLDDGNGGSGDACAEGGGDDASGIGGIPPPRPPTVAALTHWGGVSAATAAGTASAWQRRFPPGAGDGPPPPDRRAGRPPKVRAGYLSACLTAAAATAAAPPLLARGMAPSGASGGGGGGVSGGGQGTDAAVYLTAHPPAAPYRVYSPAGAAGDAYLDMDGSVDGETESSWTTNFSDDDGDDDDIQFSSGNSDNWGCGGAPPRKLPGGGGEEGCGGGVADRSVASLLASLRFSLRRGWFCPADPAGEGGTAAGCAGWRSPTSSWSLSRSAGRGGGGNGHSRTSLQRVTFKSSSRLAIPVAGGASAVAGGSRRQRLPDWLRRRLGKVGTKDGRTGDGGGASAAPPAAEPVATAAAAARSAVVAKPASHAAGSSPAAADGGGRGSAWWAAWRARSTLSFAAAVATAVAGVVLLLAGGAALVALPARRPVLRDLNDVPPGVVGATLLVAGLLLSTFGAVLLARPTLFAAARADGFASEDVRLLWRVGTKAVRRRVAEGGDRLRAPWRRWRGGARGASSPGGRLGTGGRGEGGGDEEDDDEAGDFGWSRTSWRPRARGRALAEAGGGGWEPRPPPPVAPPSL